MMGLANYFWTTPYSPSTLTVNCGSVHGGDPQFCPCHPAQRFNAWDEGADWLLLKLGWQDCCPAVQQKWKHLAAALRSKLAYEVCPASQHTMGMGGTPQLVRGIAGRAGTGSRARRTPFLMICAPPPQQEQQELEAQQMLEDRQRQVLPFGLCQSSRVVRESQC